MNLKKINLNKEKKQYVIYKERKNKGLRILPFFNFDIKKALLTAFLVIIPALFLTLSRPGEEGHFLLRSMAFVNSRVQLFYHSLAGSIRNTTDTYINLIHIRKTNRKLKKENRSLKARLFLMEEINQENKRLSRLLDFKQKNPLNFISAQVIGKDPISKYRLIMVNRGRKAGVKKNMIVINEKGVVGYVFRVFARFSQVILLTDPHASLPAIIRRSRVYGLVEGANKNICRLKHLKRRDDVKTGDIIVTSGLSDLSAGGFPIGTVTDIKKQKYGLTQEVSVRPFINPSRLEEVLIVKKKHPAEEERE